MIVTYLMDAGAFALCCVVIAGVVGEMAANRRGERLRVEMARREAIRDSYEMEQRRAPR